VRLERLEIESYALIDRATIDFAPGFTVVTGETGSGKTMLLGALDFALGGRSSADVVRTGSPRARVSLAIDPDDELRRSLEESGFGIEPDEGAVIVREMTAAGKSSARLNGRFATSAQVREIGERLVVLVGQHEQQHLLQPVYQLDALDRFAGCERVASEVARAFARVATVTRELEEERTDVGRAEAESAFARFALDEIDALAARPGEDDDLRARREFLANIERIANGLTAAREALAGDEGGALEALGTASAAVSGIERAAGLGALAERLRALQSEASEALATVARALEETEPEPGELETTLERLDALERLKRKYGGSLEAVAASRERFLTRLDRDATREERLAGLEADRTRLQAALEASAAELGALRSAAARDLQRRIGQELAELAMPVARFDCGLRPLGAIGPRGAERVDFELSPNPGERPRPLGRAASGGELSRVLLALVAALAERRPSALVFDEIDAGIGGATARAVGARLGALAGNGQVVCVTHLAQIASWGDAHYALRKHESGEATSISLERLGEDEGALEELARMLSGSVAEVALDHARALLGDVRRERHGRISA